MPTVISASLVSSLRTFSSDGFRAAVELEFCSWDENNDGLWGCSDMERRLSILGLPDALYELRSRGWLIQTDATYQVWGYTDRQQSKAKRSNLSGVRSRAAKRTPTVEPASLRPAPAAPDPMANLEASLARAKAKKGEVASVSIPVKPRPRNVVWDVTAVYHGVDLDKAIPKPVASRVSMAAAQLKSAGIQTQDDFDALVAAYKRKFPALSAPSIEALAKHCLPIIKEYRDTGSIAQPSAPRAKGEHNQNVGREILASLAEKRSREAVALSAS